MATVLIVEDNALNLKLFHDLLMIQNHKVIISKDGVNVLNIVTEKQPDLILMDIQLNGISGIDLIKSLKSEDQTKLIPNIAISAFAMKNEEVKISESGCEMYLSKPVSIDKFFSAVEEFTRKH